jgi:hypothetical protein
MPRCGEHTCTAAAGRVLARRLGPIGFLARELLDELPPLLRRLS